MIFDLINFLRESLERGFWSREMGCGRLYCMQRFLMCINQDFELLFAVVSTYNASWWRMLWGSLVIMEKRVSYFMWSSAVESKEPLRKYTKDLGVLSYNFWRFCNFIFKCDVIISSFWDFSTKAAEVTQYLW